MSLLRLSAVVLEKKKNHFVVKSVCLPERTGVSGSPAERPDVRDKNLLGERHRQNSHSTETIHRIIGLQQRLFVG